jgi:tetratricopeptide (TPR) repeat protein
MRSGRSSPMQMMVRAALVVLLCAWVLPAQSSKPISFKNLLNSMHEHGLSNAELAEIVKSRGVDFELTPAMESELIAAGADTILLAAVRTSYRGTSSARNVQPRASQPRETANPAHELDAVQTLFDQKKYDEARASFDALPSPAKTAFEGQLLLCKIEQERKEYRLAVQACNAAIQSRPNVGVPYGLNAYSLLMLGEIEKAEAPAAKAAELSSEVYYKKLLGLIHYTEEKYELVPKDMPEDSNDTFMLTLLTGAAFHNRDYEAFRRLRTKLTSLKGNDNGWNLYVDGLTAQRELNWDVALEKYKKCDADSDFIDPVCLIAAATTELTQTNYSAAKTDIDKVLSEHPRNPDAVLQGIFINLRVGDIAEAERLHGVMNAIKPANADFMDCLYYYGRNQPLLATSHCQAAIRGNENNNTVWSNAGYAALDNGDFQSAITDFAKAWELFYASKEKHTVIEELDLWWGTLAAEYYSGDKKRAKELYRTLKKTYPQFATTIALKQLPLLWSDNTVKLMDKATEDLK